MRTLPIFDCSYTMARAKMMSSTLKICNHKKKFKHSMLALTKQMVNGTMIWLVQTRRNQKNATTTKEPELVLYNQINIQIVQTIPVYHQVRAPIKMFLLMQQNGAMIRLK